MATQRRGFTLIELLIAVAITAILASIALPAYTRYVKTSRAKSAAADLVSLSLVLENVRQSTLAYPTYAANTNATTVSNWTPTQSTYFNYTLVSDPTQSPVYTLTATGITSGSLSGCTITLDQTNNRTATSQCGFTSW